jgi:hypothetical protein
VGIAIVAIVAIVIVSMLVNSVNKTGQLARGRNRCEACKSRLKSTNGRYAGTCSKRAHVQSWA